MALPVSQRVAEIRSRKLRQLLTLLFSCIKHFQSMQDLPGKAQYAASYALSRGPLTNNTDKEIVPNATSLSSFLANYLSESSNSEEAMLSTVVVLICDSDGSRRACRALLDCGSQANFVTKKFVEALGLETCPSNVSICGVNGTVTRLIT